MKCIILAAGASRRMRPFTDAQPKCLLKIGGTTLLERTIDNVLAAGVEEFGIVVGYRREQVHQFLKEKYPFQRIRFITNAKFESTNNAYSLLLAREFYLKDLTADGSGPPLLLLDSDILFPKELLFPLIKESKTSSLAVRVEGEHNDEEIRVALNPGGTIAAIGKNIPLAQFYGESIGIELFHPNDARALFQVLEQRVRAGVGRTEFYEASFQVLIDRGHMIKAVDVSAFKAMEIDTPKDFEAAKSLLGVKNYK
ncbi:MAG: phosphocholine cytidylyltransferase family protein [bacterium]